MFGRAANIRFSRQTQDVRVSLRFTYRKCEGIAASTSPKRQQTSSWKFSSIAAPSDTHTTFDCERRALKWGLFDAFESASHPQNQLIGPELHPHTQCQSSPLKPWRCCSHKHIISCSPGFLSCTDFMQRVNGLQTGLTLTSSTQILQNWSNKGSSSSKHSSLLPNSKDGSSHHRSHRQQKTPPNSSWWWKWDQDLQIIRRWVIWLFKHFLKTPKMS